MTIGTSRSCLGRVPRQKAGDAADRLGQMSRAAPVLLDLEIGRQLRDLGTSLGRVRLVAAWLEQDRRPAATDELAADREDEVSAEHIVAELLDGLVRQGGIARQHGLGEVTNG